MRWVPVRQISPGMVKVKGSWSRPCLMEHLMGWDTAANNCHLCPRPLINSEPALCSLGWVKAMKNTLSSIMPIFVLSKNGFFIQELYIQLDKGSAGFKIIHEARFIQIFVEDPSLIWQEGRHFWKSVHILDLCKTHFPPANLLECNWRHWSIDKAPSPPYNHLSQGQGQR